MVTKKAVCILGMHRSGTSTATRLINLLGVYLGETIDLVPAKHVNPEGFWERTDIVELHARILSALSMRWDTLLTLPDSWQEHESVSPLLGELKHLVAEVFSERPLWGWKDPRTCLFLDAWKVILSELNTDLCVLYVVRHPEDVANSLIKRDGFSKGKAYGIWYNYNLAALKSVFDNKVFFVSYDQLLDEKELALRRCAEGLGLSWPDNDTDLRADLDGFLRKDLRHSQTKVKDLPHCVDELYGLLEVAITSPSLVHSKIFREKVDGLFSKHAEFSDFVRQDQEKMFKLVEMKKSKFKISKHKIIKKIKSIFKR